jgi:uncharacterized delta-60 repeat protein
MKPKVPVATLWHAALLMALLVWPLCCLSLNHVKADQGELDQTFGNGGKVTTDFLASPASSFTTDQINDVAIQSDGKIVAVGVDFNGDFAIARYNADGSLDPSFGSGGKVTTDFIGGRDFGSAIAIQPDARIVVGGFAYKQFDFINSDFALARYNPNGSLDTSFGSGGKVTTDFFGDTDLLSDIVLQDNGKIIAVGTSENVQPGRINIDFAMARYDSDGGLDSSFGNGGKVSTDFFGNLDQAFGVALQSDGKILLAGVTVVSLSDDDFALARYNKDGRLDSSFGSDGKVTTDFLGGFDDAQDVVIQEDGKIVLAGRALNPAVEQSSFALARYDKDGGLDSSFGSGGKATTHFSDALPESSDAANALAIQADGKLVVVGSTIIGAVVRFAVTRFNADGTIDPSFGVNGKTTTDFFNNRDIAYAVTTQLDGKIIIGGIARNGTLGDDFALARYESGIPIPGISSASVNGKKLIVVGENFDAGAQILINGQAQKTKNDSQNLTTLIAKKAGRKVRSGDSLQVRNPNGILSPIFSYP